MSEEPNTPAEDLETEQETDTDLVRHLRKEIRERNSRLNTMSSELGQVRKQSAFSAAGVDVSTGIGRLAYEAYKGDATPEDISTFLSEYGITPEAGGSAAARGEDGGEQPSPEQQREAEAASRMDATVSGAQPSGEIVDPAEQARKVRDETFAKTGNAETANAAFFQAKLAAELERRQAGS